MMERDSLRGRRILVTGATGLIGSWLVREALSQQASVVALVRDADPQSELLRSGDIQRVSVVNGELEDIGVLERAIIEHDTDAVIHLGAQTLVQVAYRQPLQTFESNIRGTYNLLEACRRHRDTVEAVVVASSDKAYGAQAELPYREEMALDGREPYEWSKSCVDGLAQLYARTYEMPIAIARCGNVFGGGDLNWSRLVPGTIRSVLHDERPVVRSDGRFVRDYIYVRDVVDAYLMLAARAEDDGVRGHAFNFGLERPLTVLEMIDVIQREAGTTLSANVRNTARGEIRSQYLSSEKARRVLGWTPRFELEAGLRETLDWYRLFFSKTMTTHAVTV